MISLVIALSVRVVYRVGTFLVRITINERSEGGHNHHEQTWQKTGWEARSR